MTIGQGDVSRQEDVRNVLAKLSESMPPLRGLFHAAMVLDDAPIQSLNGERLAKVMAPKVEGAWNLHLLTRELPLDYFVLFSSMASQMGNPGQANYAAANAFLDSLAHYRRARELPALTVNWGALADVGLPVTEPASTALTWVAISSFSVMKSRTLVLELIDRPYTCSANRRFASSSAARAARSLPCAVWISGSVP